VTQQIQLMMYNSFIDKIRNVLREQLIMRVYETIYAVRAVKVWVPPNGNIKHNATLHYVAYPTAP